MERRSIKHNRRVHKDFALSNRLCDKFQKQWFDTQAKLEDAQTKIEDLTSELEELRGHYLVQHPTSLTALMELEERIA